MYTKDNWLISSVNGIIDLADKVIGVRPQSYYNNIEGVCNLNIFYFWSHSKLLENLLDASDIYYCLEIATTWSLTGNANNFC